MDSSSKLRLVLRTSGVILALMATWIYREAILWGLIALSILVIAIALIALIVSAVLSRKGCKACDVWRLRLYKSIGVLVTGVFGYFLLTAMSTAFSPATDNNNSIAVGEIVEQKFEHKYEINHEALYRRSSNRPSDKWKVVHYFDGSPQVAVVPPIESGETPYGVTLTEEWQVLQIDVNTFGFIPPEEESRRCKAVEQREYWTMARLSPNGVVAFIPPVGADVSPVVIKPKDYMQVLPLGCTGLAVIPSIDAGRSHIKYAFSHKNNTVPPRWSNANIPDIIIDRESQIRFVKPFLVISSQQDQSDAVFYNIDEVEGGSLILDLANKATKLYDQQVSQLTANFHARIDILRASGINYMSVLSLRERDIAMQKVQQVGNNDLRPIIQDGIAKLDELCAKEMGTILAMLQQLKDDANGTHVDIPSNIAELAKSGEFYELAAILRKAQPLLIEFYRNQASDMLADAKGRFQHIRIRDNIDNLNSVDELKAKIEDIKNAVSTAVQREEEKIAQLINAYNNQIARAVDIGLTEISIAKFRLKGDEELEDIEEKKKALDSLVQEFNSKRESEIIYSPNNKHVAFIRTSPASVVLDGQSGPVFKYIIRESIVFSNDSKKLAYVAVRDNGKSVVVCEGRISEEYNKIISLPQFSDDGTRIVFAASKGRSGRQLVVLDNKEGRRYSRILTSPTFSPCALNIAYIAQDGQAEFLVVNDKEHREFADRILERIKQNPVPPRGEDGHIHIRGTRSFQPMSTKAYISPNWERFAYTYTDITKNKPNRYAIVDGIQFGPYQEIGPIIFSSDSSRYGFWCQFEEQDGLYQKTFFQVIVDGKPGHKHRRLTPSSFTSVVPARFGRSNDYTFSRITQEVPLFCSTGKNFAYSSEDGVFLNGEFFYKSTRITSPLYFMPTSNKLAFVSFSRKKRVVESADDAKKRYVFTLTHGGNQIQGYISNDDGHEYSIQRADGTTVSIPKEAIQNIEEIKPPDIFDEYFHFVVDGEDGPPFKRIFGGEVGGRDPSPIAFNERGDFAYIAEVGERGGLTVIINHKPVKAYSEIRNINLCSDSDCITYLAKFDSGEWFEERFSLSDISEGAKFANFKPYLSGFTITEDISNLIVSQNRDRMAFSRGSSVYLDGVHQNPYYSIAPYTLTFSRDGKRFAFVANPDEGTIADIDGNKGPNLKSITSPPKFCSEGRHVLYAGRKQSDKMIVILDNDVVGSPADIIINPVISKINGQVGWVASSLPNHDDVAIKEDDIRDWTLLANILKQMVNRRQSSLESEFFRCLARSRSSADAISNFRSILTNLDPQALDQSTRQAILLILNYAINSESFISRSHTFDKAYEDWILNGPLKAYVRPNHRRDSRQRILSTNFSVSTTNLSEPERKVVRRLCLEAIFQGCLLPLQRYDVVVNGDIIAEVDQVFESKLSPTYDGQAWFWIERSMDGWVLVQNKNQIYGPVDRVDQFIISPRGDWLLAGIKDKDYSIVFNGEEVGGNALSVKGAVLSSGSFAYVAETQEGWVVHHGDKAFGPWAEVRNLVLSDDGEQCAYAIKQDGKWALMRGSDLECRVFFNFDINSITFSPDGKHLAFCAVNTTSESEQFMQRADRIRGGPWRMRGRWSMFLGLNGNIYPPAFDFPLGDNFIQFDKNGDVSALVFKDNSIQVIRVVSE